MLFYNAFQSLRHARNKIVPINAGICLPISAGSSRVSVQQHFNGHLSALFKCPPPTHFMLLPAACVVEVLLP
jgi:hypothetical protein